MTNDILKEEYFSTVELYKQLEPNQQKNILPKLNEVKDLKNKALKTVSNVSKNYLFKQAYKKLQDTKKEVLELIQEKEVEKYKDEIARLQTIFKNRNFGDREKDYLIKKSALINGFDFIKFKSYIKENTKLIGSSIMSDIESCLSLS
ncbi:hypothetical protein [Halarcobacter sp.]|uniref:hypothetical protein n=1 Tax=Halarcobacter sp. TaxID=2321133 RepID=UPI003A94E9C2